eukprot:g18726.t1
MPPKMGRKRARESTGGNTAAATASSSAPGSATPASPRTQSTSATSQEGEEEEDGGGGSDPRAAKKSRRGGVSDRDTDSNEDVDMEESDMPAVVANGGDARRAAAAAGGAEAKKGSRRKSASAVAANGEPATQPATKRGRKSSTSSAAAPAAAAPAAAASAPRSRVPKGAAPIGNGGGAAAGAGGRPPLAAPAASRTPARTGGPAGERGAGAAAVPGAAEATPSFRKTPSPAVNANGGIAANGAAAAAAAGQATAPPARARAQIQPQAQAPPSGASSPVPAARLRRVTGPESTNGDDESGGDGGGGGGGGGGHGSQAGGADGPAGTRWGAVASRGKDACAVVCSKCLPGGGVSAVLPAVERLTLKCLVVLLSLWGGRVIWAATLWVAGGLGTTVGGGGGGGSGGGGVSRRDAALSLVRQGVEFQSLEGVLAERRRYLKGMEAQDQEEQETIKRLRVFVENLDGQLDLLREQAAGGVASRGAPEDPQASEAVALSHLEEVKLMQERLLALVETTSNAVEEGQEWILSAKQDLEALSFAPAHGAHLTPEEKAGLEAEAEEEWAAVFAAPLEQAFLDLEGVHNAVERIKSMGQAKPGAQEVAELVRLVEGAKRGAASGDEDWSELKELIKEIAERKVTLMWGEGGAAASSDPESPQVLQTAEEAEELVAREVEIFSSGGTGMPDHASLTPGGSVVYGAAKLQHATGTSTGMGGGGQAKDQLTSPTLASATLPWADYMLHMLRVPGRVFAEKADAALSSSNSLGSCFAFHGGQGRLTVKLAPAPMSAVAPAPGSSPPSAREGGVATRTRGFVKVTHVSIEHARTALAPTVARSAPRAFRVLGWDADPAAAGKSAGETSVAGGGAGADAPLRPYVLLEGAEYRADGGALGVQTFEVSEAGRELAPPVGSSNHLDIHRQAPHDGSAWSEQQHGSGSPASDWGESFSSVDCSEGEGRNYPLGSECPNGAAGTLPSAKQPMAVGVRDTEYVPDGDPRMADDGTSHFAIASASSLPTLWPPPPAATVQGAHSRISAVLVLNLNDAPLAKLLMATLRECGGIDIFRDFFVVVPGEELSRIESILLHDSVDDSNNDANTGANTPDRRPPIVMVDERELLRTAGVDKVEPGWYPYFLQMILKLLASRLVRTPFYLTLDADVLCTKDGLSEEDLLPQGKGNYVPEGRDVHPTWWLYAARTLGVEETPQDGGFGVTPAVLSARGVELVLERLRTMHGSATFLHRILDGSSAEPGGGWWTEYTLYRQALDHLGVFDLLHTVGPTKLLGDNSVWYSDQFHDWNVTAAFDEDPAAFVVVQSTTEAGVPAILRKIEHGLGEEAEGEKD